MYNTSEEEITDDSTAEDSYLAAIIENWEQPDVEPYIPSLGEMQNYLEYSYSEKNLAELLHAHFDFITLAKINLQWIKPELNARLEDFRSTSSACPFDTNTHGLTVMLMQEFPRARKYGSRKKDLKEGDEETFRRRIYLHLYFNPMRRVEQDTAFDKDLFELKGLIEEGKEEQDLTESAWKKVQRFLLVRHYGSRVTVTFNEKAIAEEKKYHGYFALVSNREKDPFECLRKYRKRETIEHNIRVV